MKTAIRIQGNVSLCPTLKGNICSKLMYYSQSAQRFSVNVSFNEKNSLILEGNFS